MFRWIDSKLLGAAQWVSETTGLTKFMLEKWALIMAMIFFAAGAVLAFSSVTVILVVLAIGLVVPLVRNIEFEDDFHRGAQISYSFSWRYFSERILITWATVCFEVLLLLLPARDVFHLMRQYLFLGGGICVILWRYFEGCPPRSKTAE